jgi:hypothetical protein
MLPKGNETITAGSMCEDIVESFRKCDTSQRGVVDGVVDGVVRCLVIS